MRRNRNFHRTKILVFLPFVVFCVQSIMASTAHPSYGRAWWKAVDRDQRTEFLAGYADCAINDLGQGDLANAQWNVIEPEITRYYSSHAEAVETVPALFARAHGEPEA